MKGALNRVSFRLAAVAAVFSSLAAHAFATAPTLPSTGVDIEGLITASITAVGAVVVVAIGGYFAFLVIRKGIRWGSRAIG